MTGNVLKIKMFGKFSVQNQYFSFPQEKKKSMQVGLLLAYLLANRNMEVLKSKLIEVLWPEEDSSNPEGALRNLVYRCRMEMKKFYPGAEVDCVLLRNNSYQWKNDLPCEIDIDQFERYCKLVSVELDPEQRYRYCKNAMDLYVGDFLEEFEEEQWVVFRSVYYKRLYTTCVLETCESLLEAKRYQDVISVCDQSRLMEQMDLRVHEMKIMAYLATGVAQNALDYYNQVVNFCYSSLGMQVPAELKELYNQILECLPNQKQVDVEELEKNLQEEKLSNGTFYCNYDIFKNIYQINARAARRSLRSRFLALVTLQEEGGDAHIEEESEILKMVISEQLRKNDVFSQYNMTQYSIILAAQNMEGSQRAMERIEEKYHQKRRFSGVTINYEIKQIK